MEFLFDLLPLLVLYLLARAFTKKRTPATPPEASATGEEAPTARTGFEQLLEALAAAQAQAQQSAGLAPAEPTHVPPTTHPPEAPGAAEHPRRRRTAPATLPAPTLEGRVFDDAVAFDPLPTRRPADKHAGVDAAGFETANFEEHGLRGHRPVAPPGPSIPRSAAGVASRLRNPATAREAFVMQMLLERRGRRR